MPEGFYGDLSILNDVPLLVEAEMGRSNKSVREVLKFGEGSVIDFDKEAGDQVDLKGGSSLAVKWWRSKATTAFESPSSFTTVKF